MVSWIMLFITFLITKSLLKSKDDFSNFFNVYVVAILYSCFISLAAFINGINLNDFINPVNTEKIIYSADNFSSYF